MQPGGARLWAGLSSRRRSPGWKATAPSLGKTTEQIPRENRSAGTSAAGKGSRRQRFRSNPKPCTERRGASVTDAKPGARFQAKRWGCRGAKGGWVPRAAPPAEESSSGRGHAGLFPWVCKAQHRPALLSTFSGVRGGGNRPSRVKMNPKARGGGRHEDVGQSGTKWEWKRRERNVVKTEPSGKWGAPGRGAAGARGRTPAQHPRGRG